MSSTIENFNDYNGLDLPSAMVLYHSCLPLATGFLVRPPELRSESLCLIKDLNRVAGPHPHGQGFRHGLARGHSSSQAELGYGIGRSEL
jgi:hypothetical protein